MTDAERSRQISELSAIAADGPSCQRVGYGNKGRPCGCVLIPLDSPGADFNHRAGGDSNVVCTGCGGGTKLEPEELMRCRRADSAWNEKCRLEAK